MCCVCEVVSQILGNFAFFNFLNAFSRINHICKFLTFMTKAYLATCKFLRYLAGRKNALLEEHLEPSLIVPWGNINPKKNKQKYLDIILKNSLILLKSKKKKVTY